MFIPRLIFNNDCKKNKVITKINYACKRCIFIANTNICDIYWMIHLFRHFELRSVSKLASQVIFVERRNNRFPEKYITYIFTWLSLYERSIFEVIFEISLFELNKFDHRVSEKSAIDSGLNEAIVDRHSLHIQRFRPRVHEKRETRSWIELSSIQAR